MIETIGTLLFAVGFFLWILLLVIFGASFIIYVLCWLIGGLFYIREIKLKD